MHVLMKDSDTFGLAAHIPDPKGQPLCHLKLKLATWQIRDRSPTSLLICHHCLRAQAKQRHAANPDHLAPLEQSGGARFDALGRSMLKGVRDAHRLYHRKRRRWRALSAAE